MPRSSSAALMKIIMPPLWPTSATGPVRTASGRSSVRVTSELLAQTLPMQLGPEHAEAGFRDDGRKLAAEPCALAVEGFAEAGREHRGAARTRGCPAAQRLRDACGRNQHHQMIGRLRQRLEIRIAGLVPNLVAARIDEMDRARKPVTIEIAPDPRRPAAGAIAGADQHDVARRRERRDLPLRGLEIQTVLPQWLRGAISACARRRSREGALMNRALLLAQCPPVL